MRVARGAEGAGEHREGREEQSARDKAVKYEVTPLGLTEVKPDDDAFDMFTGEGDIDAPAPVKVGKRATAAQLLAGELGEEEQANCISLN